ncbi:hypothetical protein JHK86_039820 [Glycine max]|nr:hypothetical protein JHK86_039820 [Glycine max]
MATHKQQLNTILGFSMVLYMKPLQSIQVLVVVDHSHREFDVIREKGLILLEN